jgi:hypothetical protein
MAKTTPLTQSLPITKALCKDGVMVTDAYSKQDGTVYCDPQYQVKPGDGHMIMAQNQGQVTAYLVPEEVFSSLQKIAVRTVHTDSVTTTKIRLHSFNLDDRQDVVKGPSYGFNFSQTQKSLNKVDALDALLVPEGALQEGVFLTVETSHKWYHFTYGGVAVSKNINMGIYGAKSFAEAFFNASSVNADDSFKITADVELTYQYHHAPSAASGQFNSFSSFFDLLEIYKPMFTPRAVENNTRIAIANRDGKGALTFEDVKGSISKDFGFRNITAPVEGGAYRFASLRSLKEGLQTIHELKIVDGIVPTDFTIQSRDPHHVLDIYVSPTYESIQFAENGMTRSKAVTKNSPVLGATEPWLDFVPKATLMGKNFKMHVGQDAFFFRYHDKPNPAPVSIPASNLQAWEFNSLNMLMTQMKKIGLVKASIQDNALAVEPAREGDVIRIEEGTFGALSSLGFKNTVPYLGAVTLDHRFKEAQIGDEFEVLSYELMERIKFVYTGKDLTQDVPEEELSDVLKKVKEDIATYGHIYGFFSPISLVEAMNISGLLNASVNDGRIIVRPSVPTALEFNDIAGKGNFVATLGFGKIRTDQKLMEYLGIQKQDQEVYRQDGPSNMASGKSFYAKISDPKHSAPIAPIDFKIWDAKGHGYDVYFGFLKLSPNHWAVEWVAKHPEEFKVRADGQLAAGYIDFFGNGALRKVSGSIAEEIVLYPANDADPMHLHVDWGAPGRKNGIHQICAPHGVALVKEMVDGGPSAFFALSAFPEEGYGVVVEGDVVQNSAEESGLF